MTPLISNIVLYDGRNYEVEFHEIKGDVIPDLPWTQVYVVGNLSGKVPLVKYKKKRDNLPGGTVERGEHVTDHTLHREIREELNMRVLNHWPLGYQIVTADDGETAYQLRVYAELEKIGEFERDLGGSVIGYELVDIDKVNERIQYGEIGEWLVNKTRGKYSNESTK